MNKSFVFGFIIGSLLSATLLYAAYFSFARHFFSWERPVTSVQAALINQNLLPKYPIRNLAAGEPDPIINAGIIYYPKANKALWQKNSQNILPIASLTKLTAAAVALDQLPLGRLLPVSSQALNTEGESPNFLPGELIKTSDLLKALLIESSNDAAAVLAEAIGQQKMVNLMNQKAAQAGLKFTHFKEPTGLSPQNISTARELALLFEKTINKYPFIAQTLSQSSYAFVSALGRYYIINTTNQLLSHPLVLAGKTGYTEAAGENLATLIQLPGGERLIIVVLGAQDRFRATEKLINWAQEAYRWR